MPIRPELKHFYGYRWRYIVRPRILQRAAWKCEHCGKRRPLDVAHLEALDPENPYDESKLAALCKRCHNRLDYRVAQRKARETRLDKKDAARPFLDPLAWGARFESLGRPE